MKQGCIRDCIFFIDGACRLAHTHGQIAPECPFKEGSQSAISV